ncbi:MAG: hypothetical protein M3O91_04125, partial [Chloroflexota bacterium]|nr:hypothetical protein [Chloroflexota bacterium]
RPSSADLENMAGRLADRGGGYSVSLILTPHSLYGSSATAYIARRDGARTVVEPAQIEEGYEWEVK